VFKEHPSARSEAAGASEFDHPVLHLVDGGNESEDPRAGGDHDHQGPAI